MRSNVKMGRVYSDRNHVTQAMYLHMDTDTGLLHIAPFGMAKSPIGSLTFNAHERARLLEDLLSMMAEAGDELRGHRFRLDGLVEAREQDGDA